jgi:hypothetical protein
VQWGAIIWAALPLPGERPGDVLVKIDRDGLSHRFARGLPNDALGQSWSSVYLLHTRHLGEMGGRFRSEVDQTGIQRHLVAF